MIWELWCDGLEVLLRRAWGWQLGPWGWQYSRVLEVSSFMGRR